MSLVTKIDQHLSQSRHDSMTWADGEGATYAETLLESLEDSDWLEIKSLQLQNDSEWRRCLYDALNPHMGEHAIDLLVTGISDLDAEVQGITYQTILYYCGLSFDGQRYVFSAKNAAVPLIWRLQSHPDLLGQLIHLAKKYPDTNQREVLNHAFLHFKS